MRVRTVAVGVVLLASLSGVGAPLPPAGAGPAPTCTFSADIVVDPGLSGELSSGTFETPPDRDGSYRCQAFGSQRSGRAGASGSYGTADGDSCQQGGEGEGRLRFGGDSDGGGDTADFTFTYSPFSDDGVATGEFQGRRFEGTFTLTVLNGDCARQAVTRVLLQGEGRVSP